MAMVELPKSWFADASAATRLEVDARTVADVVAAVRLRYPELHRWLDNGRGELPEYTHVVVGDTDARILSGAQTVLHDDATVRFVAALTGG